MPKPSTSFRLTPEALQLLAALAKHLGVAQTAVLELAIREMATREMAKKRKGLA